MVKEGETAGNWLAEYLGGKEANILVIEGSVGASATLGRTEGFANIMKDHPEWKIVDSQSGDFTQAGGQQVMESYLKSYPGQFNVVVCQNDNEAYGAMDAMDAAGVTTTPDAWVSVTSDFFEVRGRLRLDDVALEEVSIVQRERGTRHVTTLWRERTALTVDLGAHPGTTGVR